MVTYGDLVMSPRKKLRIAYLSGPGDAAAVYAELSEGRQHGNFFGSDYMKQFLQVGTELHCDAYVITTRLGEYSYERNGKFIFENRPAPWRSKGPLYHFAFVWWTIRAGLKILQFKPDVLLMTANQNYWFLLFPLRWIGVPLVASFHNTLWPKFSPVKRSWRFLWQMNKVLILRHLKAVMVTSNDITRQLRDLMGTALDKIEIVRHFPTYSPSQFALISSPGEVARPPFRVFFAGRIEVNKGIFDLLEIFQRLDSDRKGLFHLDICGSGGELDELRKRIVRLNLQGVISCHGYCNSRKMASLLGKAHAVIVPTTSSFEAGFEMTCAEAILAGRPLITSAVSPALEDVREAAVEVEPDNVDQYYNAILELNNDQQFYSQKQQACGALQEPFYKPENSWGAKLKEILIKHFGVLEEDRAS
jgi:glycogen synthase